MYLTIGVNNGSGTWSGEISDESNTLYVTKNGSGTEVFASANIYTGDTNINNGVLKVADPNALQNTTVYVNVNNGLAFANGVSTANLGGLSGSGNISLTTADPNPVTISVGGNNKDTTYSGSLSGSGGLTKTGNGTLTLTNFHSYQGATTINNGTLALSPIVISGAIPGLILDGDFSVPDVGGGWSGFDPGGSPWTFLGYSAVHGPGSPYTPPTPFPAGTTQCAHVQDAGNVGSFSQVITSGSSYSNLVISFYSAYRFGPDPFQVQIDGVDVGDFSPASNSSWVSYSTSAFSLSAGTHTIAFVGQSIGGGDVSSFIDNVVIGTPPSYIANTDMLPATTPVTIDAAGKLDLAGNKQRVASLSDGANGGGTVLNSNASLASTLTISPTDGATKTFSGNIGGVGPGTIALVMSGNGIQVLTGTNTYTGGTEASGGTLDFATPSALPSTGIVTVDAGGYVALGALLGASSPAGTSEESSVETTATTATTSTTTVTTTTAATTDTSSIVAGSGAVVTTGGRPASVPEPSTVVLLLAGAAALAAAAWKRRRAKR